MASHSYFKRQKINSII